MIIISQNKMQMLNYDNISSIYISYTEPIIYARVDVAEDIVLGAYKSEERAKEVLEDITRLYRKNFQVIGERGGVTDFIYPPKVYEMPKE